jgi:hypothetical protein
MTKKKGAATSPKVPTPVVDEQEKLTPVPAAAPDGSGEDAAYADLVARGRAAVAGMHRSLWELGDAAAEVETKWGEHKLQDYAVDVGVPYKTLQSARTTARAWPEKSRRLDFSTCQALNAQIDRHNIARRRPDITMAEARDLVTRRRARRDDPSELDRLVGQVQRRLLNLLLSLTVLNEQELAAVDSDSRRELWDRLESVREQIETLFEKLENISTDAIVGPATKYIQ